MNKKHLYLLIIVIIVITIAITSYQWFQKNSLPDETTTVRIASLPNVQGLPVYVALEKGYFKNRGLDVELVEFEAPNQIIDALLQGKVDLSHPGGATGIAGIADFKNPGNFKIYALAGGDATTVQNDAIIVSQNSSLKSIQDLRGKKLGIMAGTIQWQTIGREILDKNNLVYGKDVTIVEVPLGLHAQALASGQIDASLIIEPVPTVVKAKEIGKELVPFAAAQYIANPFYAGAGIIRTEFAEQNPETAKKIMDAIKQALDDIRKNPEVHRQYLAGYTQLDATTLAQAPILLFKMYDEFTQQDIDATQDFYNIFTRWNVVDGTMNFEDLIYKPTY